jgi:hypothetical protein
VAAKASRARKAKTVAIVSSGATNAARRMPAVCCWDAGSQPFPGEDEHPHPEREEAER